MTTPSIKEAFNQYRRKQIAELRPYVPGESMNGISVAGVDRAAGSPKPGDMIARNPKNHDDQWLVAATYFADNFEPLAALSPPAGEKREAIAETMWRAELRRATGKERNIAWSEVAPYDQERFRYVADTILASGLVQDEAGWRDISTAPKDGTPFLAWEDSDRGPFKCWWRDEWPKREAYWMDYNDSEPNPTHWMPLPAPPIRSARDRGAEKQG